MYKEILRWVIAIVSQPAKAWSLLAKKEMNQEEFLSRFVYPLIGLVTLTAFLGVLLTHKEFDLQFALKLSIRTFVSSFAGFYLAAYIMNEVWQGWYKRKKDLDLWLRFIGYSSSLMFTLNIVLTLLPEFFFLRIFVFYTLFIVWNGADLYMGVDEKSRLPFTAITTTALLLTPFAIQTLLAMLMPGLSF